MIKISRPSKRSIILLCLFMVILSLAAALTACANLEKGKSERTLLSYLDLPATPTPPLATPLVSVGMPAVASPTAIVFNLDVNRYHHPSGLFDIFPPAGWKVMVDDNGLVECASPAEDAVIYISVTNTGEPLDQTSFKKLVEAREANFFSVYNRYQEIDRKYDLDGTGALVMKRLVFNGKEQRVASLYTQFDQVVLTSDLWLIQDFNEAYLEFFISFFKKIQLDASSISKQPIYQWTYEYHGANEQYKMQVPVHWMISRVRKDLAEVTSFVSPDGQAVIQSIFYEDESWISPADAGFISMELLRESYGTNLAFSNDQILANGGERLTWETNDGKLSGVTFFKSKDATLVILTMTYQTSKEAFYLDLYNVLAASHDVD